MTLNLRVLIINMSKTNFTAKAKEIIAQFEGKERGVIKGKLTEAKIPTKIINELLPVEGAAAPGAAPAEGAPAAPGAEPKPEAKEEKK